jgi:hypothetical protein
MCGAVSIGLSVRIGKKRRDDLLIVLAATMTGDVILSGVLHPAETNLRCQHGSIAH